MALTLGDNFSYQGAKPLDARLVYSTVASMKAVADSTMYDGCLAYCTATDKTYQWKSTNAVDETTGKWREFTSGGDTIQVSSMPTASADELGNVYQYIGSTTLVYTHGYFYECVSDGEATPTYSWSEVSVQEGSSVTVDNAMSDSSENPVQNKVITAALGNKVDKHQTGGVDDRLMTAAEGTKLAGIAANAEVNVQSDWNVTDTSSDAYIANKPTIPAAQVNSDWNAVSGVAQILNKPTIPDVSNYVQKSSTAGLLKNDGTVDTTTYASEAGTESLIDSTVGWTGKNLVKNNAVSSSKNGITYTVNEDGSISVYGTATANSNSEYISNDVLILKAGTYILSGCASGGSGNTFGLDIAIHTQGQTDYTFGHDYGSDYQFTVSGEKTFMLNVVIKNGVNMGTAQNPTVFKPMIRLATVTDPTYEPYHKSVEECLDDINDKLSYLEQSVTLSTSASTTVTFTDSSITANSFIEYACSVWDLVPESITGAAGSCTIVLPKVDSAQSVTVRIYVR